MTDKKPPPPPPPRPAPPVQKHDRVRESVDHSQRNDNTVSFTPPPPAPPRPPK